METSEITVQHVAPLYVLATLRQVTGQGEILSAIAELRPAVADVLAGPPMALRLGFPRDGKIDVEIAFPVAKNVRRSGFTSKTLPGLPMFSFSHVGPIVGGAEGTNLIDTRRKFVRFVNERNVLVGDDPERFLYHEGPEKHGEEAERYVTEVQYSYHTPMWLEALEQGTKRIAGPEAARRVMAGSEGMVETLDGGRVIAWVPGAIDRLDREVPKDRDRACILNRCAHHYIVQSGMIIEAVWEEVGKDLRKLVTKITDEKLLGNNYRIDESGPEPLLMIERRPARPEEYERAQTPAEKRYEACFCPLVRDAIRRGDRVSRTFCHCSGGWYAQEWAIIFRETPEVRLIQTMLEGKDSCVFGVVIPDGFL